MVDYGWFKHRELAWFMNPTYTPSYRLCNKHLAGVSIFCQLESLVISVVWPLPALERPHFDFIRIHQCIYRWLVIVITAITTTTTIVRGGVAGHLQMLTNSHQVSAIICGTGSQLLNDSCRSRWELQCWRMKQQTPAINHWAFAIHNQSFTSLLNDSFITTNRWP